MEGASGWQTPCPLAAGPAALMWPAPHHDIIRPSNATGCATTYSCVTLPTMYWLLVTMDMLPLQAKEAARAQLARKYRSSAISEEEILQCLYSIGDNNSYLAFSRDPITRMISLLQASSALSQTPPILCTYAQASCAQHCIVCQPAVATRLAFPSRLL
jgi:Protein of unknown function (DUF2009)